MLGGVKSGSHGAALKPGFLLGDGVLSVLLSSSFHVVENDKISFVVLKRLLMLLTCMGCIFFFLHLI